MTDVGRTVAKLQKASKELEEAPRKAVSAGALVMKNALIAGAEAATGGGRMSHIGKRGAKLSARYTLQGGTGTASATLSPTPPGAWSILESGAKAHQIGGKATKRRKAKVLAGPGLKHPVRVVHHPGAHGKHTWTTARARAVPDVVKKMHKVAADPVTKLFGG